MRHRLQGIAAGVFLSIFVFILAFSVSLGFWFEEFDEEAM